MDVINDLTSSLSSDLNSTELAKDLGLGFLAKSTAINGAVNLGILRIPRCHCLRRLGCHRSGRAEHRRRYDGGLLHPL